MYNGSSVTSIQCRLLCNSATRIPIAITDNKHLTQSSDARKSQQNLAVTVRQKFYIRCSCSSLMCSIVSLVWPIDTLKKINETEGRNRGTSGIGTVNKSKELT